MQRAMVHAGLLVCCLALDSMDLSIVPVFMQDITFSTTYFKLQNVELLISNNSIMLKFPLVRSHI